MNDFEVIATAFMAWVMIASLSATGVHLVYKFDLINKYEWLPDCDFCIGFWFNVILTIISLFIVFFLSFHNIMLGGVISPLAGAALTKFMVR